MKRKITMRTTAAGPDCMYMADKTYDVPGDVAKAFVDGGYAAYANGQPAAEKSAPAPPPPATEPEAEAAPEPEAPTPPVKRTRNTGKKK